MGKKGEGARRVMGVRRGFFYLAYRTSGRDTQGRDIQPATRGGRGVQIARIQADAENCKMSGRAAYPGQTTSTAHDPLSAPSNGAYAKAHESTLSGGPIMTSITATQARKRLYALVDEVQESHEPIEITGKRGSAVLVGDEDWRAVQETLYLVSIPGVRESIMDGMVTPVEGLANEIE